MQQEQSRFDAKKLSRSIIAIPLLELMENANDEELFDIIIDVNLDYVDGREAARNQLFNRIINFKSKNEIRLSTEQHPQYIFTSLTANDIRELVKTDLESSTVSHRRLIYKIWPDFSIEALLTNSIKTVKADAANISFSANGSGVCWAVLDTGIDDTHNHFAEFETLKTTYSKDFIIDNGNPFIDENGHGTHVAGIIAGRQTKSITAAKRKLNEGNQTESETKTYANGISGIACQCKLVSMKVLKGDGKGNASTTLRAIEHVQQINGYGRDVKIHGVNISIGHRFDPEWFACGQSPLCIEVNRLARSGVVVVVAAGNAGYGFIKSIDDQNTPPGLPLSITDPGNADLAITVGSTHRDMPHIYGVSYFSSKGPTGDGRLKPDLIAPGEKIISCAVGRMKESFTFQLQDAFEYCEESGTSMAAPHVSGVIAAFLSIRQEFKGYPEKIKEIFTITATDLKRDKYFQGAGLVDLMRAIQSV